MKLNPYLAFDGRCRDAFTFYEKTLGGKIVFIQTNGESPMASSMPPEAQGRIMHVTLHIGDQVLQGADAPLYSKSAGFSVALLRQLRSGRTRVQCARGRRPSPFRFWLF